MKKLLALIIVLGASLNCLIAQEFNCQVSIIVRNNVPVSTADQVLLDQLKTSIYEFMNNQQWTNDEPKRILDFQY